MMRSVLLLGLLALVGCSGDEVSPPQPVEVSVATTYRDGSLVPGLVTDEDTATIVKALYTPLVTYDRSTRSPVPANANEITTEDNITWTVQLRTDFTFHDGTPVLASNYVQAWNWVARCESRSPNQRYLGPSVMNVQGYRDVAGKVRADGGRDCAGTTRSLRGLTVLDDFSFRITLNEPNPALPAMLGYWALSPMSDATVRELEPQGGGRAAQPVSQAQSSASPTGDVEALGNGPYRLVRDSGTELDLATNPDYPDSQDRPAAVIFRKYANLEEAYDSYRSGAVDVLTRLPLAALADGEWQGDSGRAKQVPGGTLTSLTFPIYDARYASVDFRLALAAAINREAINTSAFADTRQRAEFWAPIPAAGSSGTPCEQSCRFDPTRAQALLGRSRDSGRPITIAYNTGGGHADWVTQACTWVKDTLGVDCTPKGYSDREQYFADIEDQKMPGPFVTSWDLEYPDVSNFLGPLYGPGGVNDGDYRNEKFETALSQAMTLPRDQAQADFEAAARELTQDPPASPAFFSTRQLLWSQAIVGDSVALTPYGLLDVAALRKLAGTGAEG